MDSIKDLAHAKRRARYLAERRGHRPSPFSEIIIGGESAWRARCHDCDGIIIAKANGETSAPRLCRPHRAPAIAP
jgi:glucan biosynthesis protein